MIRVADAVRRVEQRGRTATPRRVLRQLRYRTGLVPHPDPSWARRGACGAPGVDPGWFLGQHPDGAAAGESEALRVCSGCPVRSECREWAVSGGEWWSVAGGETPLERVTAEMREMADA